jgi:hypothetical protein
VIGRQKGGYGRRPVRQAVSRVRRAATTGVDGPHGVCVHAAERPLIYSNRCKDIFNKALILSHWQGIGIAIGKGRKWIRRLSISALPLARPLTNPYVFTQISSLTSLLTFWISLLYYERHYYHYILVNIYEINNEKLAGIPYEMLSTCGTYLEFVDRV